MLSTTNLKISMLFLALQLIATAQTKPDLVLNNRKSFTFIYQSSNEKLSNEMFNSFSSTNLSISKKYDHNPISIDKYKDAIPSIDLLKNQKIATQVLSNLLYDNSGNLSYSRVLEKAKFSMSDSEVLEFKNAAASKDQSILRRYFDIVLQSNYIVVFNNNKVMTYDESYNKTDSFNREKAKRNNTVFKPVQRVYSGYMANATGSVYKIALNDLIKTDILNTIATNDKNKLNNIQLPLEFIGVSTNIISASYTIGDKKRSDLELAEVLVSNEAINLLMNQIEDDFQELFQTKSSIFAVNPISSKIGTKEDLKVNKRYFVYENIQKKDGKIQEKLVGVVRGAVVAANDTISKGETKASSFYQTEGDKITEGMLLKENKDWATAGLGYGSHGIYFKADIFLPVRSLKFYIDINYDSEKFPNNPTLTDGTKTNIFMIGLGAGVSKEFYFGRKFVIAPYAGAHFETIKFANKELSTGIETGEITFAGKKYDAGYGNSGITYNIGVYGGLSIFNKTRLIGAVGYNPISYDKNELFGKNSTLYVERSPIKFNVTISREF